MPTAHDLCLSFPAMALSLRPARRASSAHADRADYIVLEDGQEIGRVYEGRGARAACWFWSITIYVEPMLCIVTDGRSVSLQAAMEQFKSCWSKMPAANNRRADPKLAPSSRIGKGGEPSGSRKRICKNVQS